MRCIFCKQNSAQSKSVEHILPEALGNKRWVLPPGMVCDPCNNYFAIKIEKPLLESGRFKNLRARHNVPNKKGWAPPVEGHLLGTDIGLSLALAKEGQPHSLWPTFERDSRRFVDQIMKGYPGTFIVPASLPVEQSLLSRLLAKIAVEFLAERLHHVPGWEEPVIDDPQLDPIRRYARRGDQPASWPYHERRIYPEDSKVIGDNGEEYQTLHESDLLCTPENELYSVVCIFGVEYTINMGGPEIEGYQKWLKLNDDASPLYLKPQPPGAGRPNLPK